MHPYLTSPSLPGTRGRVLLVEDDVNSGEALCELLQFLGFSCHWSKSESEALEELTGPVPNDVLLLDLDSRRRSAGVGFVRRARSAGMRLPPILIFSGLNEDILVHAMREIGTDHVLRKPTGGDALCSAIEATMATSVPTRDAVTPH